MTVLGHKLSAFADTSKLYCEDVMKGLRLLRQRHGVEVRNHSAPEERLPASISPGHFILYHGLH